MLDNFPEELEFSRSSSEEKSMGDPHEICMCDDINGFEIMKSTQEILEASVLNLIKPCKSSDADKMFEPGWYRIVQNSKFRSRPDPNDMADQSWYSGIFVHIQEVIRQDFWIWGKVEDDRWVLMLTVRERVKFVEPVAKEMNIAKDTQPFRKTAYMQNQVGTPPGTWRVGNLIVNLKFTNCWSPALEQTVKEFITDYAHIRLWYYRYNKEDKVRFCWDAEKDIHLQGTIKGKQIKLKHPVLLHGKDVPNDMAGLNIRADHLCLVKTQSNTVVLHAMCANSWEAQRIVREINDEPEFDGKVEAFFQQFEPHRGRKQEENYSASGMMLVDSIQENLTSFVDESPISQGIGAIIKMGNLCLRCVNADAEYYYLIKHQIDEKAVSCCKVEKDEEGISWDWHILTEPSFKTTVDLNHIEEEGEAVKKSSQDCKKEQESNFGSASARVESKGCCELSDCESNADSRTKTVELAESSSPDHMSGKDKNMEEKSEKKWAKPKPGIYRSPFETEIEFVVNDFDFPDMGHLYKVHWVGTTEGYDTWVQRKEVSDELYQRYVNEKEKKRKKRKKRKRKRKETEHNVAAEAKRRKSSPPSMRNWELEMVRENKKKGYVKAIATATHSESVSPSMPPLEPAEKSVMVIGDSVDIATEKKRLLKWESMLRKKKRRLLKWKSMKRKKMKEKKRRKKKRREKEKEAPRKKKQTKEIDVDLKEKEEKREQEKEASRKQPKKIDVDLKEKEKRDQEKEASRKKKQPIEIDLKLKEHTDQKEVSSKKEKPKEIDMNEQDQVDQDEEAGSMKKLVPRRKKASNAKKLTSEELAARKERDRNARCSLFKTMEYIVKDSNIMGRGLLYRVRWKGLTEGYDDWLPRDQIPDELYETYLKAKEEKKRQKELRKKKRKERKNRASKPDDKSKTRATKQDVHKTAKPPQPKKTRNTDEATADNAPKRAKLAVSLPADNAPKKRKRPASSAQQLIKKRKTEVNREDQIKVSLERESTTDDARNNKKPNADKRGRAKRRFPQSVSVAPKKRKKVVDIVEHTQAATEQWSCKMCTLLNDMCHTRCDVCGARKPSRRRKSSSQQITVGDQFSTELQNCESEMKLVLDQNVWEVESIRRHRYDAEKMRLVYLVKWKNYPESENTWESEEELGGLSIFKKYNRSIKNADDSLSDVIAILKHELNNVGEIYRLQVRLSNGTTRWMAKNRMLHTAEFANYVKRHNSKSQISNAGGRTTKSGRKEQKSPKSHKRKTRAPADQVQRKPVRAVSMNKKCNKKRNEGSSKKKSKSAPRSRSWDKIRDPLSFPILPPLFWNPTTGDTRVRSMALIGKCKSEAEARQMIHSVQSKKMKPVATKPGILWCRKTQKWKAYMPNNKLVGRYNDEEMATEAIEHAVSLNKKVGRNVGSFDDENCAFNVARKKSKRKDRSGRSRVRKRTKKAKLRPKPSIGKKNTKSKKK